METDEPRYHAYLLRIWQTETHGAKSWLASLQRCASEEAVGFSNLEALFAFLARQTGAESTHMPWIGDEAAPEHSQ